MRPASRPLHPEPRACRAVEGSMARLHLQGVAMKKLAPHILTKEIIFTVDYKNSAEI